MKIDLTFQIYQNFSRRIYKSSKVRDKPTFLEKYLTGKVEKLNKEVKNLRVQICQREAKIRQLSKKSNSKKLSRRIRTLKRENDDFGEKLTSTLIKYSILKQSECKRCSSEKDLKEEIPEIQEDFKRDCSSGENDSEEKTLSVKMEMDNDTMKDERIRLLEEQNKNIIETIVDLSEKLEVQRLRNDQTEDEWFERCGEQVLQLFIWNDEDQERVRKMKNADISCVTILNRLGSIRRKEMDKLEEVKIIGQKSSVEHIV